MILLALTIGMIFMHMFVWIIYIHRTLAHRAYTMHPLMIEIIRTCRWLYDPHYTANFERFYVANHIKHHIHADTKDDPHSPFHPHHPVTPDEVSLLTKNIDIHISALSRFYGRYPIGPYVLAALFYSIAGVLGALIVPAFIYLMIQHAVLFNYAFHKWPGYTNVDLDNNARNIPALMFLFIGEEYHANHHAWPNRANNAVRKGEFDFVYSCVIRPMAWLHLIKINGDTGPIDLT